MVDGFRDHVVDGDARERIRVRGRQAFLALKEEMGYDEKFLRGWFWDAELLIRAQRKKLRILEMPVKWVRAEKSSFNFRRELKVIPYMFGLRKRLHH